MYCQLTSVVRRFQNQCNRAGRPSVERASELLMRGPYYNARSRRRI